MRKFGSWGHAVINHDQQLEVFQRFNGFELIGESNNRVSTADEQTAHLAFAWFKNFFSQQRCQHFTRHSTKSLDAMWCARRRITWCNDLRPTSVAGIQEVATFKNVTFAIHATTDCIQCEREVLHQCAVRRHVGSGSCSGSSLGARRKHSCRSDNIVGIDFTTSSDHFGCVRCNCCA